MDSKVSVIIPVFNVEAYLHQCLDSVVDQTYKNLEIILIDDGSPDNCGAICDEYAARDGRISVIHKKNGGLPAARNDGLSIATGKWVSFVDSDDWCELTLYEKAVAKAEETEADVVMYSLFRNAVSSEERIHAFSKEFVTEDAELIDRLQLSVLDWNSNPFPEGCWWWGQGFPWDKLLRRSIIEENHLRFAENVKADEDIIFNIHVFQFVKKAAFFDEALYHWRMNQGSIGHKYTPDRAEINRAIYQEMIDIGRRYGLGKDYDQAVDVRTVNDLINLGPQCYFHPQHSGSVLRNIWQLQKVMDSEPFAKVWKEVGTAHLGKTGKVMKYSKPFRALGCYLSMKRMQRGSYMDAFDPTRGGGYFGNLIGRNFRAICAARPNPQALALS